MSGENNEKKLSFKTKIGYAIGQMTDSTGYNVYYFFFLYFLTDFAGIPAGVAGTISLIAIMWDAVTDPIVGNISDNLKSPYGRRRPLMIGATIPYAICVFLLFNNVSFGTNVKFAYFVVLAILFWSCYKTYVIPFFALGAELTDDFNERTTLRSWASVFLQLAVMLASAAPPMILEMAGKAGLQGARGWNAVGVSFGLIILISSFICWTCTRGGEIIDRNQEEKKQVEAQEKANLFKNFLQILKLKPALLLAMSVFLWNITTVFMSSGAVYALTGLLRASAGQQSTAFVVQCVMGIVWLPLINMLANRIDKKFIHWAGMGISAVIMLCFTFIGFGSFPVWLVYVSIFAFGNSVFWTVYYSMMYDISELDEFKTGSRREGIIIFGSTHLYGHSQVITPEGNCVWEAEQEETICTVTLDLDLVDRCRKYGTIFMDHYMKHLFEYNFPMPYGDDFTKAPLYEQLGIAPRNADEYEKNVAAVMENPIGRRASASMEVEDWKKNLDEFLARKK